MEANPYAVFTYKRRVKSLKGLLKGVLKEEKGFFKTLNLKRVETLGELTYTHTRERERERERERD